MKEIYYAEVVTRYYDKTKKEMKNFFKIPNNEDIEYIWNQDKRIVLSTTKTTYDRR